MATYRSIASSETDAESPITQELMDALALNPPAIAEGASGAPKIEASALGTFVMMFDDLNASPSNDSVATSGVITTAFFEIVQQGGSSNIGETAGLRYRTATDGGSTPTSWTTLLGGGSTVSDGVLILNAFKETLPANTNYLEFELSPVGDDMNGYAKVTVTGES